MVEDRQHGPGAWKVIGAVELASGIVGESEDTALFRVRSISFVWCVCGYVCA